MVLGAILGPSWAILGPPGAHFGVSWEAFGSYFGVSWKKRCSTIVQRQTYGKGAKTIGKTIVFARPEAQQHSEKRAFEASVLTKKQQQAMLHDNLHARAAEDGPKTGPECPRSAQDGPKKDPKGSRHRLSRSRGGDPRQKIKDLRSKVLRNPC